jgi:predicted nuclease with RNAse H fold
MSATQRDRYSVGWDVGGWNCDKNPRSRDAIVILDNDALIVGTPWRGNLRESILQAASAAEWVAALFALCRLAAPERPCRVTLGIDAPLAFPEAFIELITKGVAAEPSKVSSQNGYLFRYTERRLAAEGFPPLSPIKGMIGSQATKAMHVAAKFTRPTGVTGVWSDGAGLTLFETYPTVCRRAPLVCEVIALHEARHEAITQEDIRDAFVCAAVAHLYANTPAAMEHPTPEAPRAEGWIWRPTPAAKA